MSSRSRLLPTVLLALSLGILAPPAVADPGAGRASAGGGGPTVTLTGNGYGHGKGLSQHGAQRAAKRGRSHRQILRFYYPRTRFGRSGGTIKVWVSGDTRNDLVVKDRRGLKVRSVGSKRTWRLTRRQARRWRITPTAGGARSAIAWRGKGGWHTWRTVRGDAEFTAGGRPVRLLGPAGPASYRGALRSATNQRGRVTVNVLPLEQYLRGVVPLEVPALWAPAAVRAQAVAARTYAAFERRSNRRGAYDLCDTSSCQVYGGASVEHSASDAAIRKTRKQVVTKRRRPIFAQFNASSGGWTVAGGRPYLRARKDPWSRRAYHHWQVTLTAKQIQQQWPGIGSLKSVKVTRRDGNGEWNGRAEKIRITGSEDSTRVSGDTFRVRFGLRSTWFKVG